MKVYFLLIFNQFLDNMFWNFFLRYFCSCLRVNVKFVAHKTPNCECCHNRAYLSNSYLYYCALSFSCAWFFILHFCEHDWENLVKMATYVYMHTYIYFLLRQVSLRQPQGQVWTCCKNNLKFTSLKWHGVKTLVGIDL